jgi:hypothetical protein
MDGNGTEHQQEADANDLIEWLPGHRPANRPKFVPEPVPVEWLPEMKSNGAGEPPELEPEPTGAQEPTEPVAHLNGAQGIGADKGNGHGQTLEELLSRVLEAESRVRAAEDRALRAADAVDRVVGN